MTININVTNKHAIAVGAPVIVCGNSDYLIKFAFDSDWADANAKTARFVYVQDGEVRFTDVLFTGDTAEAPVLANIKEVLIGVFAGNLHTTTPARIPCEASIRCGTGAPVDPTPTQYDQIMELLRLSDASVLFIDQDLTDEQQAQARANIGAVSQEGVDEAVNAGLGRAKESGEFKGDPGEPGASGQDGKTPVKGEDYFTEADKAELVNDVLAALPTWEGGSY